MSSVATVFVVDTEWQKAVQTASVFALNMVGMILRNTEVGVRLSRFRSQDCNLLDW